LQRKVQLRRSKRIKEEKRDRWKERRSWRKESGIQNHPWLATRLEKILANLNNEKKIAKNEGGNSEIVAGVLLRSLGGETKLGPFVGEG